MTNDIPPHTTLYFKGDDCAMEAKYIQTDNDHTSKPNVYIYQPTNPADAYLKLSVNPLRFNKELNERFFLSELELLSYLKNKYLARIDNINVQIINTL